MRAVFAWCYRHCFKPIAFRLDPELVHDHFIDVGHWLGRIALARWFIAKLFRVEHPILRQQFHGVTFANPVGLSAGFDKDGLVSSIIPSVGFGFAEIGTVTAGAYAGNPKPRLLRLPKSHGIVVNYGLKGEGATTVAQRLQSVPASIPRIISIGRTNSVTTVECRAGILDYQQCLEVCLAAKVGDVYELNISCPNTSGGEPFTTPQLLTQLLGAIRQLHLKQPLWLKMPINLAWEQFQLLLEVAVQYNVAAVVIGNLNKDRTDQTIMDQIPPTMGGAISGKPTWQLSNDLIAKTYQHYSKQLMIVGVGGIFSAEDAYTKIKLGASLVELITGMIFQGPQLIGQINQGLVQLLKRDGYTSITQAIGASVLASDVKTH